MSLDEQHVVIVGGSSGMGFATARAAALEGARVTIASSSQAKVTAALADLPDTCDGSSVDITDEPQVEAFFDRLGDVDHLVFTARDAFTPRPLAERTLEDARSVLDVRFWGAVAAINSRRRTFGPAGRFL